MTKNIDKQTQKSTDTQTQRVIPADDQAMAMLLAASVVFSIDGKVYACVNPYVDKKGIEAWSKVCEPFIKKLGIKMHYHYKDKSPSCLIIRPGLPGYDFLQSYSNTKSIYPPAEVKHVNCLRTLFEKKLGRCSYKKPITPMEIEAEAAYREEIVGKIVSKLVPNDRIDHQMEK